MQYPFYFFDIAPPALEPSCLCPCQHNIENMAKLAIRYILMAKGWQPPRLKQ